MHSFRALAATLVSLLVVALGCSGGGDGSSSGGTSGTTSGGGNPPGTSCVTAQDGGSTTSSSRVCESNPLLAGCRICLEVPAADAGGSSSTTMTCVYACRLDQQDCPSGQTCTAQPGGSRDSGGTCRDFTKSREVSELGYCK